MSTSPRDIFERISSVHTPGPTPVQLDKAVVLGGSVAGLLAARILADHANSVVIMERDESGATIGATARPGVPQGLQVHTLLPGGSRQLERWFPGIVREAQDAGAVLNGPDACVVYADDVRQVRTENSELLSCSRPFLENLIRQRTLALPNVRLLRGQATGLGYDAGAVTAVQYQNDGGVEMERTDFVVDAMGRASKLSEWLERDGWEVPELRRMRIDINYATGFFKRAESRPPIGAAIARYSPHLRNGILGALQAVEDGQWMVLLAGYGDLRPGRSLEDFSALCAELPPVFGEVARGELVGEIRTYHQADSRRREFARLKHLPARLVSVGDAVASFNPVYGQGISSAALHASCLSEYLRTSPALDAPAREFFALQRVVVDSAWDTSTSADAARLDPGRRLPIKARLQQWIVNQILAASIIDEKVATAFNAVAYMTAHPSSLAAPATMLRALIVNRRAGRGTS
jgi:2-polyprenyl-6-methoxyphenol hydroxylase-like FAD-dependent oxidoreductase